MHVAKGRPLGCIAEIVIAVIGLSAGAAVFFALVNAGVINR